jgi:hypothetical protein
MKMLAMLLSLSLTCGAALAAKPCEELKTEIAAKLDAAKVAGYTLTVVEADKAGDGKVVGSCEHGSKKIVYVKEKKQ